MSLELKKAAPVELRSLGLTERWLQDQISADTSILGLGDLEIVGKEHRQPVGGRIDFLMVNTEDETYYEVEVMLCALDESHIIRTIEYWDIERQRRPSADHRAVIVAEQITSRFFNVLRLLNRAVPLIAIKLSAFSIDNKIFLHPVTVLDVIEETAGDELDQAERKDRAYWEKKSDAAFLAIVDKISSSLQKDGLTTRLTYNQHHIALGTTGYNFCWFSPRKSVSQCRIGLRIPNDVRDSAVSSLQDKGIDATPCRTNEVRFNTTTKMIDENFAIIAEVIKQAEKASKV